MSRSRSARSPLPVVLGLGAVLVLMPVLAACQSSDPSGSDVSVAVTATDDACTPDPDTWAAGTVRLSVTNSGSAVNELYVRQGDEILAEREDIAPGTTADITVDLDAGSYDLVCKPGMVGDGITTTVTVTEATQQ
jgi:iron uptake system component EfeO